jgi:hypothetical protein
VGLLDQRQDFDEGNQSMSNLPGPRKRGKSRATQSASTVFKIGLKRHTYKQPTRAYRDWSFRPERAAMQEFAAAKEST